MPIPGGRGHQDGRRPHPNPRPGRSAAEKRFGLQGKHEFGRHGPDFESREQKDGRSLGQADKQAQNGGLEGRWDLYP